MSAPLLRAAACIALAAAARAHDGPPYPIAVDESFAGRTISIWADPDVGIGTFYFYVEPAGDAADALLPIELRAVPKNERWTPAEAALEAADEDSPYQLVGEVAFEARGPWSVFIAHPATGDELVIDVEVTPPGSLGPIDILWFAFPFLAIAFLWVKGLLRQRAHDRTHSDDSQ